MSTGDSKSRSARLPFSDTRVLDVSHIVAGPVCGMILAEYGADVIKVEPPRTGERSRSVAPFIEAGERRVSSYFATVNRNRRGIVLDLKSDAGKSIFRRLAQKCDVVIENFAPGTMDRLGLGYSALGALNPHLVYAAISGFGQLAPYIGPWSSRPANNATSQAMSGLMELSGDKDGPPAFIGQAIGDTIPALWAVIGILVALEQRRQTGRGQFIDVAMYDSLAAMCFNALTDYHVTRVEPRRGATWHETFSDRLPCADGYIAVSLWGTMPERWSRLWQLIGREDMLTHPQFDPKHPGCPVCFPIAKKALTEWLTQRTRAEAVQLLIDLGFSAGPVQTVKEVYESEQLQARNLFVHIADGLGGTIRTAGIPLKFSDLTVPAPQPAPALGADTADVLRELLGMTDDEIDRLGIDTTATAA